MGDILGYPLVLAKGIYSDVMSFDQSPAQKNI